jgi:hypothetical protein
MELSGHYQLTKTAVNEFLSEFKGNKAFAENQLKETVPQFDRNGNHVGDNYIYLQDEAIKRDLNDLSISGHWANVGQKHHFMRRFDGQTSYLAFQDGCKWIYENALEYVNAVINGRNGFLIKLADACHAIEDSFTPSHAERVNLKGPNEPGSIIDIKIYTAEVDMKVQKVYDPQTGWEKYGDHKEMDACWRNYKEWWDYSKTDFSEIGIVCKNAVKAFLHMVFNEIMSARLTNSKSFSVLNGWNEFQSKWIKASSGLSENDNVSYKLIKRFYSGFDLGFAKTAVNFDEEGLANAIYQELGKDSDLICEVFFFLNENHTVDADDVAVYYLNKIMKNKNDIRRLSLQFNKKLQNLLIRILDEGYTASDEKKCIEFLRSLNNSPKNNILPDNWSSA